MFGKSVSRVVCFSDVGPERSASIFASDFSHHRKMAECFFPGVSGGETLQMEVNEVV